MKGPVALDRRVLKSVPSEDLLMVPLDPRTREEASLLPAWDEVRAFAEHARQGPESGPTLRFQGFPLCVVPGGARSPGVIGEPAFPAPCLECRRRPECPGPGATRTLILGCEGLRPDTAGPGLVPAWLAPVQVRSVPSFDPEDCPYRRGDRPLPRDPCFLWTAGEDRGLCRVFPPTETTAFDLARFLGRVEDGSVLRRDPACDGCPLSHRCGGFFRQDDGPPEDLPLPEPADRVIGPFRSPDVQVPIHRLIQDRATQEPEVRRVALVSAMSHVPDLEAFWTALHRRFPDLQEVEWQEPLPVLRLDAPAGGRGGAIPLSGGLVRWFRRHRWRPVRTRRIDLGGRPGWATTLRLDPPEVADIQSISVQFTEMCVANCVMCNVAGHFKRPLVPFPEAVATLFEVAASGVRKLDLFGGEITLRRDLFRLLSLARDLGMSPMFVTTGHFLTSAFVRRLADAGLAGCNVSLDGSRVDIHDRIRNSPGLFRRAIRGIRALLREPRIQVSVGTVILAENLEDLVSLVRRTGRMGVKEHFFFFCVSSPILSTTPRWLTREQAARFVREILPAMEREADRWGVRLHLKPEIRRSALVPEDWIGPLSQGDYNLRFHGTEARCRSPGFHPFVAVDRTVFPCQAPSGIVRGGGIGRMGPDRSLLEVLSGEALAGARAQAGHFPWCRQCIDPDEVL